MLNLDELQKNIDSQTRNGRKQVYIPVSIMEELGVNYNTKQERVYVDAKYLEKLMSIYKKDSFRNSLKVNVTPVIPNKTISNKEQKELEL